ncbi:uncharacterized protein LOC111053210 [Nilaparvata lugens]|uniref:uncharacterized protein LOC111053210 n=1 Tax=Nilaparvata lugens TaxID=108931 RepID=UPI00193E3F61|nr:uncharacterized protein LOC111053210 [Nilaparvata lugens]
MEATDYAVRETLKYLTKQKEDKENAKQCLENVSHKSTSYDIEKDCVEGGSEQTEFEMEGKILTVGGPPEDNKDNEQRENELNQSASQSSNNENVTELKDYKEELESQMQQALIERENYVKKKMNFQMLWESEKQYESYKTKIKEAHEKWISLYNKAKLSFEKELKRMQFEMEARHLSDLIRIHKKKMLELRTLKEIMERHFYGMVDRQQIEIQRRETIIKELMQLIDAREEKLKNWELKITDIMREFQNLMKFMLVEAPNQTEVLVDFEQILEESLRVPQAIPIDKYVPSIENGRPDGLTLEGIDQFLKECDASIGKVYSTSVEVIRQSNDFDIQFARICTEIQFEEIILNQSFTNDKDELTLQQDFKPETKNSRLSTILEILKRYPSLQRIVISTNITNK